MTTKHTPGPWVVNWESRIKYDISAVKGRHIALASCCEEVPTDKAQNEADARLIASAPDLLAELLRVKAICLRELGIGIVDERVLSKATGGSA